MTGYGAFNEGTVTGEGFGQGTLGVCGANGDETWNVGEIRVTQHGDGYAYANGIYGSNGRNFGMISAKRG